MPELAEVEYYRKQWAGALGQRVHAARLHGDKRIFRDVDTESLRRGLPGVRLEQSATRGKQMVFRFGRSHWLGIHLGMTGKLFTADADFAPSKHDHLVLEMREGSCLVFQDARMFGKVRYSVGEEKPKWLAELPPEVLSPEFTRSAVDAFLKRRKGSPIKAVLLMQERFPGVGNWMADEILWRARIRPDVPAGRIGPKKRIELYDTIQQVCEDALRVIGTDWSDPPDEWLFNHRWKDGGRCPQTGKPLRREEVGGRTTCWSPGWQVYGGR